MTLTPGGQDHTVHAARGTGKLVGLEALRFFAAFAVLAWHYQHFYVTGTVLVGFVPENQPFYAVLAPFYIGGEWGVHLFWCISGFIFAWKYGTLVAAGGLSFRRFAILRLTRLYPLHFVTLLAVALLQVSYVHTHGTYFVYSLNDLRHFLLNLTFASYWGFEDGFSFNGPAWSISAEILVYVLFFWCCRLVGHRPALATPAALGVFVLAAVSQSLSGTHSGILVAASFFYLGVLSCQLQELMGSAPRSVRYIFRTGIFLAVCVALWMTGTGKLQIEAASPVMFPAIVLLFQFAVPATGPRIDRGLMFLGDMTYASYMLHFPVQLAIVQLLPRAGLNLEVIRGSGIFFVAYVVIVCVLAQVVFRKFELPVQIALRRLLLASPAPPGRVRRGAQVA